MKRFRNIFDNWWSRPGNPLGMLGRETITPPYLAGGVSLSDCVAAYSPSGAADFATSKVNLAHPGTNDATNGTAFPTWDAVNGWNIAGGKYLKTGIIPPNNQTYSVLVKFTSIALNNYTYLFGCYQGAGVSDFGISPAGTGTQIYFRNGQGISVGASLLSGVVAMAGNKCFSNGVDLGTTVPAGSGNFIELYIGGTNVGGSNGNGFIGSIQRLWIYSIVLTPAQIATLTVSMGG